MDTGPTAGPMLELLDVTCSPAALTGALGAEEAGALARTLKALADPAPLRVLSLVAGNREVCVCDLTEPLGLSQPTVSHHLKVLVEAGFLQRDKRGVWAYYSMVPGALDRVVDALPGARTPTRT